MDFDEKLRQQSELIPKRIVFHPARKVDDSQDNLKLKHTPINSKRYIPTQVNAPKPERKENEFAEPEVSLCSRGKIADILEWGQARKIGPGLLNLGNTCYLNAALQCLTYSPPLANYCLSREHSRSCRVVGFCAFCELERHINAVFSPQQHQRCIRPQGIVANIKKISRRFKVGYQQDSHEFIRFLIDGLQNALIAPYKARVNSPRLPESTVISRIFGGYLRSQVKCTVCSYESNTYDPFLDMSLELKGCSSIYQALFKFCSTEHLDGDNKYKCDRCKKLVPATKTLRLEQVPAILTIQLKRFFFRGYHSDKINSNIEYPLDLELKKFCTETERAGASYSLYGVLVHQGHHSQTGHYYSYVKASSGIWYCMDDDDIRQVSQATVLKQQAYILFYKRDHKEVQRSASLLDRASSLAHALPVAEKSEKSTESSVKPLLLLSPQQRSELALPTADKLKLWADLSNLSNLSNPSTLSKQERRRQRKLLLRLQESEPTPEPVAAPEEKEEKKEKSKHKPVQKVEILDPDSFWETEEENEEENDDEEDVEEKVAKKEKKKRREDKEKKEKSRPTSLPLGFEISNEMLETWNPWSSLKAGEEKKKKKSKKDKESKKERKEAKKAASIEAREEGEEKEQKKEKKRPKIEEEHEEEKKGQKKEKQRKEKKEAEVDSQPNRKSQEETKERESKKERRERRRQLRESLGGKSGEEAKIEESLKRTHSVDQQASAKRQKVDEFDAIFDLKKNRKGEGEGETQAERKSQGEKGKSKDSTSLSTETKNSVLKAEKSRKQKQLSVLQQLSGTSTSQFDAAVSLWAPNPSLQQDRLALLSQLVPEQPHRDQWDEAYDQGKVKKKKAAPLVKKRKSGANSFQRFHQSYNHGFTAGKRQRLSPGEMAQKDKRRERRFKERVSKI